MIGYQILAIEQDDENYLCDKVDAYFSVGIRMIENEDKAKEALRLYDSFGESDKNREFLVSKDELIKISQAKSCRKEDVGLSFYHEKACDGVIIIPKTKDSFISAKKFFNLENKTE